MEIIELYSENIILKRGNKDDYLSVYEFDFRKLTNIFEDIKYLKSTNEYVNSIYEYSNMDDVYSWIIFYNNIPVGHIVADRIKDNKSIELSYNLHPNYWGKGIMKKSIELVSNYLLNYYNEIRICVCSGNEKSKSLLDKLNFKYVKTNKNKYCKNDICVDEYEYILKKYEEVEYD